jgi:hypothetical protein
VKTKAQAKEKGTHWPRILTIVTVVSATLACSIIETPTPTTRPTSAPTRTPIPTWTPVPTATPTPKPTTGDISGRVIDSTSDSAVPNANVYTDPPTVSVTADAQGRYTISEVPPGVYTITAAKPGYTNARVSIAVTAGKTTTADVHLMATSADIPTPKPKPSLTDGLVAYYPFNGNADDESGNGNHGIVYGVTLTTDRLGNPNSAYSFDGVNDYIASNSNISLNTTFSVILWFKYTEPMEGGTLFQRGYQGWCWYEPNININETSTLTAKVSGCDNEGAVGSSGIISGEWYQVAIVARDGSQEFYMNGEKIASAEHTLRYMFAYKAFIGVSANQNTPVDRHFHGIIDDVRIYSRALSEAEIWDLYQEGM